LILTILKVYYNGLPHTKITTSKFVIVVVMARNGMGLRDNTMGQMILPVIAAHIDTMADFVSVINFRQWPGR